MQRRSPPSAPLWLLLLLSGCLATEANRVYIHPFYLFAADNASCETLQSVEASAAAAAAASAATATAPPPLRTVALAPLDAAVLTPDARDAAAAGGLGGDGGGGGGGGGGPQNVTQRTAVLAELLNTLGVRLYQALSGRRGAANTLMSPVNTYGSLVTFYLGASVKTASSYQELLGLSRDTDPQDCVSLVDGHKVLKTLQSINSLVDDDGPEDEVVTQVWAFAGPPGARLSDDFVRGTQDFSDASFTRSLDLSRGREAEALVNGFVESTSEGKVKDVFRDLSPGANLLFMSSFVFKGNWKTAFQPERTSPQEFHVDDNTTVTVPLMTHTGPYHYFSDKARQCTVVKLALSKRSYMLLVLPNEGIRLQDIEGKLRSDVITDWHRDLREGHLELSLPKFSLSSVTDLRQLLGNMAAEVEDRLLGSEAEFDRLSSSKPFTIDKVLNKVQFEMSEEGAETQDRGVEGGVPLKLTLNRPFFFSVTEGHSNAILMLGKITNPTL